MEITKLTFDYKGQIEATEWFQYFDFLLKLIELSSRKVVITIDEFSWLHTKQSSFVEAFADFYDKLINKDVLCIITSSAVSWLNKNVFRTSGGLHGKASLEIKPFNLQETTEYLLAKREYSNGEIMEYYLFTGGVVRYLEKINPSENQLFNLKEIYYNPSSPENQEFDILFDSIFDSNKDVHKDVVLAFKDGSNKNVNEIINILEKENKFYSYPTVSSAIKDLVVSKILTRKENFGNKTKEHYFLTDLFCYFYVKLISKRKLDFALINNANIKGLAFEIAVLLNIDLLKKEIGRSGFETKEFSWSNPKAQIDLILDYGHHSYSLIEAKYHNNVFQLGQEANSILNKKDEFLNNLNVIKKEMDIIIVSFLGINNIEKRFYPLEIKMNDVIESYRSQSHHS